jgi:Icc protein
MFSRRHLIKAFFSAFFASVGGAALWQLWWRWQQDRSDAPSAPPPNFEGRKPLLSFFLLSDLHISATDDATTEKLHMALSDIVRFETPVDTIVLGGDLVDYGREADYGRLKSVLAKYKLPPLHANMGNHEYYDIWLDRNGAWAKESMPNGKKDAQARERFMLFMGYQERTYHQAWINGVHLIMLSQEAYVQERPEVGEGAWYSDDQLAWLEKQMQAHADGRPAFIFIHQPLPPAGEDGGTHRLIRAKEFRRILAPYRNVFVFSGHTHQNLETKGHYVHDATFHWFSNASVGRTRSAGSVASPVQGLYVQLYPNEVVVLGREFSNRTWIKAAEWTVTLT